MDKETAQNIIRDTFEQPFNSEKFVHFIKNFLYKIDESKSFHIHGDVEEMFHDVIKTYEHIGTYNSPEGKKIDIMIVYLQTDSSLDHARSTQRNFAARYLRDRDKKDAALMAFVSSNPDNWRFSLVKMDYKWEENATGKMKVKEEFTPARRWSFLVGVNEKSHTAQSRLIDILMNDEQPATLEEIEKAFDIETVTKEFFLKYRELFQRTKEELDKAIVNNPNIKDDFEKKGVDAVNFAKKLLGQIIFLYFLQKKGWFGVGRNDDWGTGSKSFLRELFNKKHVVYNNFFNDVLEHLFYDALRTDRSQNNYYFDLFDCRIPFLNGGLFDPIGNYDWIKDDILLPDELFSNGNKTKEGDIGDGIIDVFDRYNFTVKEDEPLEKEVAIDPELLGKAYEKFNAIRPDNYDEFGKVAGKTGENKFNKTFGVYYTPREIVHYMCRQSLIGYLATKLDSKVNKKDIETLVLFGEHVSENETAALKKEQSIKEGKQKTSNYKLQLSEDIRTNAREIDNALAGITVCDPAVGSGAFPVGMMSEIVMVRKTLSAFLTGTGRAPYIFKRQCIEHSLCGVDIDPGAVEITKLRLWLSLVVDEDNCESIKPLPNLDYRIMQGNSLISGIDLDTESELFKDEAGEKIERFRQKKDEFVSESNADKKSALKEEIDNLMTEIFKIELKNKELRYYEELKVIENKYLSLPGKEQRDNLIRRDKEKLCKRLSFDPKSVAEQLKEYTDGKKIKHFFMWKFNFPEIFYMKTDSEHGFDVVIANPPYIQLQKPVDSIRHYADLYEDEEYKTFERTGDIYALFYEKGMNLLKDKGSLCYITSNKWMRAKYGTSLRRFFSEKNPLNLIDLGPGVFDTATVDTNILLIQNSKSDKANLKALTVTNKEKINQLAGDDFITLTDLSEDSWIILSPEEQDIKRKIECIGTPLKEWDINIYRGVLTGLNEAFIVDGKIKDELIRKDPKSAEIIKPILRGRDIKRYEAEFADLWLINTHNGYANSKREYIPPIDINNYQAVKEHLDKYWDKLEKRQDKGITPYNLRSCTYLEEFEKEKIAFPVINRKWSFPYVPKNIAILAPMRFITASSSLKYIRLVFSSLTIKYYWSIAGNMQDTNGFQMDNYVVEKISIPEIPATQQKPFEILVDKIISKKERGEDTANEEREIDIMVYKLYDFTPEEIKIVEEKEKS